MKSTENLAQIPTMDPILSELAKLSISTVNDRPQTQRHKKALLKNAAKDERIKEAAKTFFQQKYGNQVFALSTLNLDRFDFDLKFLKSFGGTINQLRFEFSLNYVKKLANAIGTCENVVKLEMWDLHKGPCQVPMKINTGDMNKWRRFLGQLNVKFPLVRDLTFVYSYKYNECEYVDAFSQTFSSLTHLTLVGRIDFSIFMRFIQSNPTIEYLNVSMMSMTTFECKHADHDLFWKLPIDFIEQIDTALPNLKDFAMCMPCTFEKSKNKSKAHLKNLKSLTSTHHGPDTWKPNLLAIPCDKLEELVLQLTYENSIDFLITYAVHFTNLKQITINGYDIPGRQVDNWLVVGELKFLRKTPSLPTAKLLHFIKSSGERLNKIIIRWMAWGLEDMYKREGNTDAELRRKFAIVVNEKINGYSWQVSGNFFEMVFAKVVE